MPTARCAKSDFANGMAILIHAEQRFTAGWIDEFDHIEFVSRNAVICYTGGYKTGFPRLPDDPKTKTIGPEFIGFLFWDKTFFGSYCQK